MRLTSMAISALVPLLVACGRDRPSGLDLHADSVAAAQPVASDTVYTSTTPARLATAQHVIIEATRDTLHESSLRLTLSLAIGRGQIALFSGGNLKVFDTTGKFLWATSRYEFSPGQAMAVKRTAFGGRGPDFGDWVGWMVDHDSYAPGAVISAASIRIHNDSIVLLQGSGMINIFNSTGRYLGVAGVDRETFGFDPGAELSAGDKGWLLRNQTGTARPREDTVSRAIQNIRRVSLQNGELGPVVRSREVANPIRHPPGAQGRARAPVRSLFPLTPSARLAHGMFYYARGDEFSIDVYDEFGRHRRAIRVETNRVPLTRDVITRAENRVSQSYRERAERGDSVAVRWLDTVFPEMQKIQYPEFRHVVAGIWVGDDGSIAVRRADMAPRADQPGDSIIVDILGADGRFRGRVALPQTMNNILHFTGSDLYIAERAGTIQQSMEGDSPSARVARDVLLRSGRALETAYERLVRVRILDSASGQRAALR